MRVVLFCLVFAALPLTAAEAQSVRFEGTYVVKTVANCNNIAVGDVGTMRYAPSGVGNPVATASGLSFLRHFAASAYSTASGAFQSTLTSVDAVGVFNKAVTFTGATLALTFQDPASIDATTQAVNLRGQVSKFDNDGTCTIDFQAALQRRPE